MANNKVLSIDITNESITIVEITASGKKQTYIHKVLIFETPEDAFEDTAERAAWFRELAEKTGRI